MLQNITKTGTNLAHLLKPNFGLVLSIVRTIFPTKRGVIKDARVGDVRGRRQASDYVGQHVPWWSYLQRFDFCICIYVFVFFG